MASVFLSYDRDDSERAAQFAHALEKAGHQVWWDLHLRGGAQFTKVIEEALKAADVVAVLWSANSVQSAWVCDEAAAGRDSGRLVPVTIDGTAPPLGFRQFHTIDLSAWHGRGKAAFQPLLAAVENQSPKVAAASPLPSAGTPPLVPRRPKWRWIAAAGLIAVALVAAIGWRAWSGRGSLPIVEVAATDARSQAAASDLFVKLGALARIGQGKWELVDASSAPSRPDLVFRTADTSSTGQSRANLVLLDGNDQFLMWSREFDFPAGAAADLRQQVSLTAGRVLGCALEARAAGGLPRDLLKIFLDGCAQLAELSQEHPEQAVKAMRSVIIEQPRFAPAWSRLLYGELGVVALARSDERNAAETQQTLRNDIDQASKVAPDLPEITLAEAYLQPPTAYATILDLIAKAKARAPDKPEAYTEEAIGLSRVGRMEDGIFSARRAAELDPLSPKSETDLIITLAHAGQVDAARRELARDQRLWAGTGALRDAQFVFHLRYGNPRVADQMSDDPYLKLYLKFREDPSAANVEALLSQIQAFQKAGNIDAAGFAVLALGELHRTDDVFSWIAKVPSDTVAGSSEVLFRPALADARKDPRFMLIANRIGLIAYWQKSGKWPDFCFETDLPYDCKAEAAKLTRAQT